MRSIRSGFPSPENSAVLIVVFPWSITRCMTAIFACKDTKTPLIIRRLPRDLFFFACPMPRVARFGSKKLSRFKNFVYVCGNFPA